MGYKLETTVEEKDVVTDLQYFVGIIKLIWGKFTCDDNYYIT